MDTSLKSIHISIYYVNININLTIKRCNVLYNFVICKLIILESHFAEINVFPEQNVLMESVKNCFLGKKSPSLFLFDVS